MSTAVRSTSRLSARNVRQRADEGIWFAPRDLLLPVITDPAHPEVGKHPFILDSHGEPAELHLTGIHGAAARRYFFEERRRADARAAAADAGEAARELTFEEFEAQARGNIALAVAVTDGWRRWENAQGEPEDFSKAEVEWLYTNDYSITQQVVERVFNLADFFGEQQTSSASPSESPTP